MDLFDYTLWEGLVFPNICYLLRFMAARYHVVYGHVK